MTKQDTRYECMIDESFYVSLRVHRSLSESQQGAGQDMLLCVEVLQCVAGCCSVLQFVVVCCNA